MQILTVSYNDEENAYEIENHITGETLKDISPAYYGLIGATMAVKEMSDNIIRQFSDKRFAEK